MTERVIDRFEIIKIDLHERKSFAALHRQVIIQIAAELPAVGQSRQRVVHCLVSKQDAIIGFRL
ncbi:hypothetical protein EFR01_58770 [Sinorhizobium fredii]|nr:hypothetical protein EFR01_58770 [Sinorhizobium fredii]